MSNVVVKDDGTLSELKQVLKERGEPEAAVAHVEAALAESVAEVAPPDSALPGLTSKLAGSDRIGFFAPQLAELYDLSLEAARKLIAEIHQPSAWTEGPAAGVKLLPVATGPKAAEALAALVWLEPGSEFPHHPHLGAEKVLVLEGGYRDSSGAEFWRGELHASPPGSEHSFRAIGGICCICAGLNATPHLEP